MTRENSPAGPRPASESIDAEIDSTQAAASRFAAKFPDADRLSIETHMALSRAFVQINHALQRYLLPQGFDLIRAQHNFLAVLFVSEEGQLPLSDIARQMGVSAPYVTKLLDQFESEGLVERVFSVSDRRVTYARLTPAGEKRCSTIVPGFVAFIEQVGSVLSSSEKAELTRLLSKYASGVSQLEERPGPQTP